jgi:hypothetical protein
MLGNSSSQHKMDGKEVVSAAQSKSRNRQGMKGQRIRNVEIKGRQGMKSKHALLVVLVLGLGVICYTNAEDLDLITAIQQRSSMDARDVSAFLQYRMDPPVGVDGLIYLDIAPNPDGDDVILGRMIDADSDWGDDLYGYVYGKSHIVVRSWDESGTCFVGPLTNPTTLTGSYYDEDLGIVVYIVNAVSPPRTLPRYRSWFVETWRDGVADNWVPTDPSWFVDDETYRSPGTGTPGWRGSYYARIYDAAVAGLTYVAEVEASGPSGDDEQTLVFFADPADPEGYCYEFSIIYGPPATFTLKKIIGGVPTNLIGPTPVDADIDPYDNNDLKVVAGMVDEGLKITLYVEEEFQASAIDDTPYTLGVVGVGIHDTTGWGFIEFGRILLHRLTPLLDPPPPAATGQADAKRGTATRF